MPADGGSLLGSHTPWAEHTPQKPPLTPWGNPVGNGAPNPDDQEVTFLRGRGWIPPGQPSQPPAPPQPDGGWIPLGQPSEHPTLAEPGAHMGHLTMDYVWVSLSKYLQFAKPCHRKVRYHSSKWYHKVQCIKDHYPEMVAWESIVRSLKGVAVDMARYTGPTASVSNILQKLTVIFRVVMSFNVLVQNFYKVMQGNHEKVPSLTTRLEGTLNQIWLKMPQMDSWLWGVMAPQRSPFPWDLKTHKRFHLVFLQ